MKTDWHAERYAAAAKMAAEVKAIIVEFEEPQLAEVRDRYMRDLALPRLRDVLAEYDRTKDAP